jgi:hypothetical protein
MDDGTSTTRNGFEFYTLGFSLEEHYILQRILWIKFGLRSNIQRRGDKYCLYIPVAYTVILRELISPYIIPSFHYKLQRGGQFRKAK